MPFIVTTTRPCSCKPQNYWRNDLIDEKRREGLAGPNGEVLCPACVAYGQAIDMNRTTESEAAALVGPSRLAVATLEEARTAASEAADRICYEIGHYPDGIADAIHSLPDGTLIEVESIRWADLRERAGLDRDGLTLDSVTLATFNAKAGA